MALALVAWLSIQVGKEPAPQIAAVQQNNPVRQVSAQADDYLMAHQEFSPGANVHTAAAYIQTVADR
jgi:hypothetical protein